MSYTKPDQSPFTTLQPCEFVVQLDTGDLVAIDAHTSVEPNTGNTVVQVTARAVNADGSNKLDGSGRIVQSGFSHTSCPGEIELVGGIPQLQRLVILVVLGEDPAPLWQDPIHAQALEHASIRTNLVAASHAGPVADLFDLL